MGNAQLPSGTVTFLFTDIEGSTSLLRAAGDEYAALLDEHRSLIRTAIADHDGHEVGTEGDSFFVAFSRPTNAVNAAVQAQLVLCAHSWPDGREVMVRMGVHTGEASVASDSWCWDALASVAERLGRTDEAAEHRAKAESAMAGASRRPPDWRTWLPLERSIEMAASRD